MRLPYAYRSWTPVRRRPSHGPKFAAGSLPSCPTVVKPLEFHHAATAELESAFDWYLTRDERVASRFLDEVSRAIGMITESPQRWPVSKFRSFAAGPRG